MAKSAPVALIAAALLASLPALAREGKGSCPDGQAFFQGECRPVCSTEGSFDPASCACPAGHGMLVAGGGLGRCHRLACAVNAPLEDSKLCECPAGYAQKRDAKRKTRCVPGKATATAK